MATWQLIDWGAPGPQKRLSELSAGGAHKEMMLPNSRPSGFPSLGGKDGVGERDQLAEPAASTESLPSPRRRVGDSCSRARVNVYNPAARGGAVVLLHTRRVRLPAQG